MLGTARGDDGDVAGARAALVEAAALAEALGDVHGDGGGAGPRERRRPVVEPRLGPARRPRRRPDRTRARRPRARSTARRAPSCWPPSPRSCTTSIRAGRPDELSAEAVSVADAGRRPGTRWRVCSCSATGRCGGRPGNAGADGGGRRAHRVVAGGAVAPVGPTAAGPPRPVRDGVRARRRRMPRRRRCSRPGSRRSGPHAVSVELRPLRGRLSAAAAAPTTTPRRHDRRAERGVPPHASLRRRDDDPRRSWPRSTPSEVRPTRRWRGWRSSTQTAYGRSIGWFRAWALAEGGRLDERRRRAGVVRRTARRRLVPHRGADRGRARRRRGR